MTGPKIHDRRTLLRADITKLLQGRALTAIDIGAMLEKDQAGVDSALRGMERRGEVVRLPCLPGTWAKWALRGGV
ncbi:MAG TPA: hypothetical protein VN731_10185 [Rhodanobacter sp.]|nr:hypothetical protein [Rhodanobacter sp.]